MQDAYGDLKDMLRGGKGAASAAKHVPMGMCRRIVRHFLRRRASIIRTLCLSESAIAASSTVQRAPVRLHPQRCMATHTLCIDEFIRTKRIISARLLSPWEISSKFGPIRRSPYPSSLALASFSSSMMGRCWGQTPSHWPQATQSAARP